jgi:hypothetical protein
MAKQVTSVERETVQNHPHALEREQVTLTCGDGSEYIFERATDNPRKKLRLTRRVTPNGEASTTKAQLPSSVKESLTDLTERLATFGIERGWEK